MTRKPYFLFWVAVISLVLIIFSITSTSAQASGLNSPDEFNSKSNGSTANKDDFTISEIVTSPLRSLFLGGLKIYQLGVADIGGSRCGMYPSCSSYGVLAVKKHGGLIGLAMTADRLIHEAEELQTGALVNKGGKVLVYDPLEYNDFWWHKGKNE
ncbi:MAG: membrane protein insertion efficiency factor YidD [Candidatus Schekmanbacteria bacterium]|nr:membrane protein insertion efficiency factor YidD [Candidatus Schekmanbacteria bacterium]